VTDALTLATLAHRAPQLCRPDESAGEHLVFLQWCFARPRPDIPQQLAQTAHDRQWLHRAAQLDSRLRDDAETPDQAVRKIAEHALIILRTGVEAAAVRELERPGTAKLTDLVALMKLMHDMGATARTTADLHDFRGITPAELQILVEADAIRARYAVSSVPQVG
jgi:hypothetical protein